MNTSAVIVSQYLAALEMLHAAIAACPAELWNDPADAPPTWHVAYHALFYAHLYLQASEQTLTPWAQHRPEYQFMGPLPWPPHALPQIGAPYTPAEVQEYLALVQQEVRERVPATDLAGPSGFAWLPFSKLELLLYELRHLQQHTGELMERLSARAGVTLPWVGQGTA